MCCPLRNAAFYSPCHLPNELRGWFFLFFFFLFLPETGGKGNKFKREKP